MIRSKKKPASPCQAATGLPLTKLQLASYDFIDTADPGLRQAPFGVIRLAQRFGLSVATAAAVAEANSWGVQ